MNQKKFQKGQIHQKEKVDFAPKGMFGVWKDIDKKGMKWIIREILSDAMKNFYVNFIMTS